MMSKQLFTTKTFWLNVLVVGIDASLRYIGGLNIDPMITMCVAALLNILNRLQTDKPAHL
jgi:hypothetical protein